MLDDDFVAALMDTTLTVVKSSTDGGSYETFVAKMFLASTTEVGLVNENGIAEGANLALFGDNNSRLAYPTTQAVSNSEYTDSDLNASKAWYWWLRTPYVSNAYYVSFVNASGALHNNYAFYGHYGVRPLCNLSSGILVSDTPNSDGNYEFIWNRAPSTPDGISVPATCYSGQNVTVTWGESTDEDGDAITYTLERSTNSGSYTQVTNTGARTYTEMVSTTWNTLQYRVKAVDAVGNASSYIASSVAAVIHNQPPVISGSNADLGIKRQEFSYAYTVTDADGDAVTVVEAIDGTAFNTRAATLGQENTCNVSGNTFTGLTNAAHTLTITATDSAGNSSVRTLTFTKAINGFTITLANPLSAQQQPTRCNVVITREIPAGGTFKVEVCNNPFDDTPVWEDCTNAVLQGTAHVFENDVNTAIEYGLNIRVTVGREDALTTCWVSGIGGNFE